MCLKHPVPGTSDLIYIETNTEYCVNANDIEEITCDSGNIADAYFCSGDSPLYTSIPTDVLCTDCSEDCAALQCG